MPKTIQLDNEASQRIQTTLDGQTVFIELKWNQTVRSWYMSVLASDETPYTLGRRLFTNVSVFNQTLTSFIGDLVPVPTTNPPQDLGRNAWGETHKLVYNEPA